MCKITKKCRYTECFVSLQTYTRHRANAYPICHQTINSKTTTTKALKLYKKNMIDIEKHPLQPFLPPNARLLMLGSFPPPRKRWSMDFFYPNRSNMMWEIMGLVFFGDSQRLVDAENRTFRLSDIRILLGERGIAIFDTATAVRRLSGNASDKDLEIVEKTDIPALLSKIPLCHDIVCTGQKSFSVLTEDYGVPVPAMGSYNEFSIADCPMRLWRMPSSSRAYPMPMAQKAEYYRRMIQEIGLL